MNAGHADVVDMGNIVSHDLGRYQGFLGHWDIAGAGRNHDHGSFSIAGRVLLQDDGLSRSVVIHPADDFLYRSKMLCRCFGREYVAAMASHAFENSGDLERRLAAGKD